MNVCRWVSRFAVALILGALLIACVGGSRRAQRKVDRVVFRVPTESVGRLVAAPDGTLFLTTNRDLGFERVSGDSTLTFAASDLKLMVREAGVWRNYEPQPDAARQCYMSSIAVSQGHPVIGGSKPRTLSPPQGLVPCMAISDGEKWNDVPQVRAFTDQILFARPQPGGIILFWNRDGQIVELVRGRPIIYRTRALKLVRGAASRDGLIYLAGDDKEPGATVVTIPRKH